MFYSQFILAKKGPLGTIWIAAHLERKLRKNQVADTDIGVSVDSILFPDAPIALRLSSHLLLGVVRIYSRKVNYLFDDCSEALLKVKQAFRSTAVDLPPEESTAPYHSITLPETFDLDDFELPDNDVFQGNYVDHHVSTKDQITLQDKMEGVVYTTSQFGLDERFGDGDASLIGLDLDEVLLGDKAAPLDHDELSANPEVSHKKDDNEEVRGTSDRMQVEDSGSMIDLIDGQPTLAEASEYAQGPSTPGLQEPNLFGTQVDQVNDEADCNNSADLVSMEIEQKESIAHQMGNDVVDCSVQNNEKHVGVDLHHGDSEGIMVEVGSKREEEEHLSSTVVTEDQENSVPDDHCLKLPLMDSSNKDHPTTMSPESAGGMIDASNMPEKVEDLHDGVLMNDEPTVVPLDHHVNNEHVVAEGVSVNETVASPSSHAASEQENLSLKTLADVDGSRGPESDGHLEDDNTLSKLEVLNDIEISKSERQPCSVEEAQVSHITSPLGSPGRPEVVDVEAQASQEPKEIETLNHASLEAEKPAESYLRPCTSHQSQPSLSPIEGEKCHETDISNPALGHHDTVEPSVLKEKPDSGESGMLFGNQILNNEMESRCKSAASDMPEPEKMLSLAYQRDGEVNDMLLESTPVNQSISESHTDAAGTTCITGKKRSFTESTLTMQSVDLVESYGGAQSKRTAESIPDDDDLLSSILAGRRSSVLKVKPSPAVPEIASTKRFRSGSRTSAIKRKVLMDDIMVLHGDTIRLQLTSTEDIRRVRKKAPCTRHEILMIQRQFLEDEIFREPIFTDVSADLTILRNDTLDLTGIKVYDSGLDSSFMEKTNDQESYSKTNTESHGVELEVNNEPMAVQHQENTAAQPTESHQSEVNMAYQEKDLDSSQNAEMNNVGGNIGVSEAENCSVAPRIESSAVTELFENDFCMPNDDVATLPLTDETNDLVDPIHTNTLSEPSVQNMNAFPIPEDEFVEDHRDRSEVGAIKIAEPAMEIKTQVVTDGVEANDLCPSSAPGSDEMAEHAIDIRTQILTDGAEANDICPSSTPASKETDEHVDNQASFNGDLPVEESGNCMLGGLNEDQIVSSGLGCDDKDTKSDYIFSENTKVECLHSVALDLDENKSSLNDEDNPVCQEAALQSTMCPEVSAIQSPLVYQKDEDDMVAHDTGFLNVGDDEILEDEDDDDFISCAEGTHLENTGWSSRTRAVAKYLQTLFDKEDRPARPNLQLDNILAGKTRKEASRMFFETLVLKTRDYVHVEQAEAYDKIHLKPRSKLMKADF